MLFFAFAGLVCLAARWQWHHERIAPGQWLVISVAGACHESGFHRVAPDGQINFFAGQVKVAGLRPHVAAASVQQHLSRTYQNPSVNLRIETDPQKWPTFPQPSPPAPGHKGFFDTPLELAPTA